jgi:hypothetical protein
MIKYSDKYKQKQLYLLALNNKICTIFQFHSYGKKKYFSVLFV